MNFIWTVKDLIAQPIDIFQSPAMTYSNIIWYCTRQIACFQTANIVLLSCKTNLKSMLCYGIYHITSQQWQMEHSRHVEQNSLILPHLVVQVRIKIHEKGSTKHWVSIKFNDQTEMKSRNLGIFVWFFSSKMYKYRVLVEEYWFVVFSIWVTMYYLCTVWKLWCFQSKAPYP